MDFNDERIRIYADPTSSYCTHNGYALKASRRCLKGIASPLHLLSLLQVTMASGLVLEVQRCDRATPWRYWPQISHSFH